MGDLTFSPPIAEVAAYCQKHHIHRLALFGSALRGEDRPDSDLDLLVEFEPGHSVGFLKLAAIERELSEMLGRKVDLRTPSELSRYFRAEVMRSARVWYAQA